MRLFAAIFVFATYSRFYDYSEDSIPLVISVIVFLIMLSSVLGIVDFLGANIKSRMILGYRSTFFYTISADIGKGFGVEFFKNIFILSLYFVWFFIKDKNNINTTDPLGIMLLFAVFFIFNIIILAAFKMRKDRLASFEAMNDDNPTPLDEEDHNEMGIKKNLIIKPNRKIFFPILASILIIFNIVITAAGLISPREAKKAGIEAVGSKSNYTGIIENANKYNVNVHNPSGFDLPYLLSIGFLGNASALDHTFWPRLGSSGMTENAASVQSKDSVSQTNTQVEGIDEGDVVKTDGNYIYYIKENDLVIVKTSPADQMKIIYTKSFSSEQLTPVEIMLYKNYITVIMEDSESSEYDQYYQTNLGNTVIRTYNVANPESPVAERTITQKGTYKSSRLIENRLYVITTSDVKSKDNTIIYPQYDDTASTQSKKDFDYNNLFYLSNTGKSISAVNYISVFPMDNKNTPLVLKAYAGNADNIYVSEKYIYMAESSRTAIDNSLNDFWTTLNQTDFYVDYKYGTYIYRVKMQGNDLGECDTAFVDGMLHNQFSMDEYNGNLRLAVEYYGMNDLSSRVYILDDKLNQIGSLNGLAPGEQIYSTRFIGNRLYLVTFKRIDPLFVIDLKKPTQPKLLGKLKIPGYSEYLHPYDENHIIGFGKDTSGGNEFFSWYQGIKMAMFDVTDVNNPKEKFVEIIGDRGSDSELLRNHKSLLYMKDPNIMAFPVSVTEKPVNEENDRNDSSYGTIKFQGAYVYNVSSSEGFKLRGKISHLSQSDIPAITDDHITKDPSFIDRIIYINNVLYTLSGECIKATDYTGMKELGFKYFDKK
ncbi:beta-propeller domain-containing protein [Pseudobacteroides cellulosolvens]|uniref:beta-propeller domain-containing protein n=1 Tax=Pseudobacteroides cellulosolvens TaxID=35825 RepID=UPI000B3150E4|nr:beta-propeller domain-containing protein [Pseudobacteroides cellulosolvens]